MLRSVNPQCQIAQTCVTDISDDDCPDGQVVVPGSSIFGCCPSCGPRSDDDDVTEGCNPKNGDNCLPDGRFGPVQCKGNQFTGRCFCSDEKGRRIFGQMWRDQAEDMTCACSRRRAELEAEDRVVTLHCTANGDYEPLQCDDGMCWCAQPRTGQPTVGPIPEEDITLLPCYSAAVVGDQYLRKCESLVLASSIIAREQREHGTNFLGQSFVLCDYDGSYGPYQITNGIAYCTGRDGKILGAWQSSSTVNMTCNCARDTMVYFPERGMTVSETCLPNGNYQPKQNVGDVYYCVDSDGYHGPLKSEWPKDNCDSYQ
ncbi:hypothetical protein PYW07_013738 [Mythimna separata]|uniref:Thyroglobulin type-1 domain-containing protein n=1 Tax=Mythimna separata TaxID=271217 RepID=A0AAD7YF60_MYTSE|nr:hypothetical protein PYW07_013738 [Mythimna separata]